MLQGILKSSEGNATRLAKSRAKTAGQKVQSKTFTIERKKLQIGVEPDVTYADIF